MFPPPRGCEGSAPSVSPSQGMDLGIVSFSYHSFWGGPSILAALSSASHLWEERVKGTSLLLPCLHGEGVRALHVLPISEQGVCTRPTLPTYISHPQCKMSRARSLGWVCIEEGCSSASHPISCGAALFQYQYFHHFFCDTLWFLPSRVAVGR